MATKPKNATDYVDEVRAYAAAEQAKLDAAAERLAGLRVDLANAEAAAAGAYSTLGTSVLDGQDVGKLSTSAHAASLRADGLRQACTAAERELKAKTAARDEALKDAGGRARAALIAHALGLRPDIREALDTALALIDDARHTAYEVGTMTKVFGLPAAPESDELSKMAAVYLPAERLSNWARGAGRPARSRLSRCTNDPNRHRINLCLRLCPKTAPGRCGDVMPSDAKLLRDARALVADVKRMGESEDVGIVRQAILDAREDYLAMLESRADTRTVAAHMRAGPSAAEKAAIARSAAAVSAKAPAPARRPSAAGLFNAMLMLEDARAQREACALLAELKSIGVDGDPLASLNAALEEAREWTGPRLTRCPSSSSSTRSPATPPNWRSLPVSMTLMSLTWHPRMKNANWRLSAASKPYARPR